MKEKIDYFKDFLNKEDYEEILKYIENIPWGKVVMDIPNEENYVSHFCHTLIYKDKGTKPKEKILNKILNKIQKIYNHKYLPHNLYFNYYKFGDEIRTHKDKNTNGKNKTFILYCTKQWSNDWHGNTIFYSKDALDIVGGIVPYPNTAVCFDSDIFHTSDPISKYCLENKVILVYQLEG